MRIPLPPLEPPYPDKLTAEEAARYLRFSSVLAFKKWARRRQLAPERRGPKITLWPKTDIDALCALERRCAPDTPHQPPSTPTTGDPVCPK